MLEVREVEFDDIRQEWMALEEEGRLPTVFQTMGWMETWWQTFGHLRKLELLLLAGYDDGKLVGIAPLYKDWMSLKGIKLKRILRYIGYPESDYNDFIIIKGREEEFLTRLWDHLKREKWDIAALADFYHGSKCFNILEGLAPRKGYLLKRYKHTICPYIALPQNFPDYLKTIKHKTYTNIFYYRRRLEKRGEVKIEVVDGSGDLEKAAEDFFRLHRWRWKARGQQGALAGPSLEYFHRRVMIKLSRYCRVIFLVFQGRRVAVVYAYNFGDRFCSYLRGFDPGYADYRVGNIVILAAIDYAIGHGLKFYDFMRGGEDYKFLFAKAVAQNRKLVMAKKNLDLLLWQVLNLNT